MNTLILVAVVITAAIVWLVTPSKANPSSLIAQVTSPPRSELIPDHLDDADLARKMKRINRVLGEKMQAKRDQEAIAEAYELLSEESE